MNTHTDTAVLQYLVGGRNANPGTELLPGFTPVPLDQIAQPLWSGSACDTSSPCEHGLVQTGVLHAGPQPLEYNLLDSEEWTLCSFPEPHFPVTGEDGPVSLHS